MTNQTYTPDMVTDVMLWAFDQSFVRAIEQQRNHQTPHDCIADAINASPLWAEVQQLREAKRELAEALTKAEDDLSTYQMVIDGLYKDNRMRETLTESRKILAKHGGDQ